MAKTSSYLRYKHPIAVIGFIIIAAGIFSYTKIKVELLPDVTFPKIKVIADNGDQPVENMLITVTQPLEEAIKKSENLQLLQSTTSRGSCEISAFFNWNSDINLARQQTEGAISQIRSDLPAGLHVEVEKMNPSILAVAGYSLEGDLTPVELKSIALFTVKPYLEQITGLRQVAVTGGRNKEYQVVLDKQKMSKEGITPAMVSDILSSINFISSNGYINEYNRLYLSLTDASVHDLKQLEETIIKSDPEGAVMLGDIAEIRINGQLEYLKIKANGKDVPLIALMKQPEANLLEVNKQLQQRVSELNKSILPGGVRLRPYYNQSDFVSDAINSIRDVLWIGLLLAIMVTFAFLRSFKSSLIILITVPLSLMLTILGMVLFGYNFNIMTLGAIAAAIGLVIDDAVVVVEQIHRTHEEHPGDKFMQIIPKAMKYLLPAMIGSSLSTIVIFVPFRIMTGVAGAYFTIMTNTMMITLVSSFLVSWIFLPVFYLLFFGNSSEKGIRAAEIKPKRWVHFFVDRPWISVSFAVLLILAMIKVFPKLPSGFLPEMDEGAIVLDFDSPPGTSLETTEEMLMKVDDILANIPEVESYSRRTGTQMGFFITEPSRGDYLIKLNKKRKRTTEEVIDNIRVATEQKVPALIVDFGQVIGDMLGDLMTSVQPIEIKVFGNNEEAVQRYSRLVASEIEKVPGTADVFDGIVVAGPSVAIKPRYAILKQFGLSPADFYLQTQVITGGYAAGSVQENMQFCNVRMMYPGFGTMNIEELSKTDIFLNDGTLIPLSRFASIDVAPGAAEINRENLKKVGFVTARLNQRDLGSTLSDIRKAISENISIPPDISIEYGGAYKEQQKAFSELFLILLIAVALVFTLILFLYRKIKVALMMVFIILLAPAGSALLLYLTGIPLNVGSYIGIIMIVGIVGEAAIFTYLQYEEERKKGERKIDAIVFSISIRLRPKLMTALSAIVALLPLGLALGTGAKMHQSLAIAVIGGLIIALPVLLLILPSILNIIENE